MCSSRRSHPQARPIRHAARHDSAAFLAEELDRRRALGYPPFWAPDQDRAGRRAAPAARAAAQEVRERLQALLDGTGEAGTGGQAAATLLGPASLFRLRGRERQVLVLKTTRRRAAVAAVGAAVAAVAAERRHAGVSFSVDVDPQ